MLNNLPPQTLPEKKICHQKVFSLIGTFSFHIHQKLLERELLKPAGVAARASPLLEFWVNLLFPQDSWSNYKPYLRLHIHTCNSASLKDSPYNWYALGTQATPHGLGSIPVHFSSSALWRATGEVSSPSLSKFRLWCSEEHLIEIAKSASRHSWRFCNLR